MSNKTHALTLTRLALDRMGARQAAQRAKDARAQAVDARLRQEHGDVLRIFQRDILTGAKLPKGMRIDSIIHGHCISVFYADDRSIVAEHLFRIVDDTLAVTVYGGLDQRWTAKRSRDSGGRKKNFGDFLDAFIWLFRSELEEMMG